MSKEIITKEAVQKVLSDYWKQIKIFWWQGLLASLSPAIGNIFVFYLPPLIVAKIVDRYTQTGHVTFSDYSGYLITFTVFWLFGEFLWRVCFHFLTRVEGRAQNNLAKAAFDQMAERDYDFFTNNFVGSLSKKAIAYARNFETFFDILTFDLISEIIPLAFVTYILWGYAWWLSMILFVSLILEVAISIPIIKKRVKLVAERHDANSTMVGRISDSLTNMLAVKSFAKEKAESKAFGKFVDDFTKKFIRATDYQNLRYDTIVAPVYVFTNVIGLVAALYCAQIQHLPAGSVVVVFSYFSQITRIFWNISGIYRRTEQTISESAEFSQLCLNPPAVQDVANASVLKPEGGMIEFRKVGFRYTKKDKSYLENVNLVIKPNQKIGLVGPSGGGKTTITKLLLRFIDTQEGEILIDGQGLKEVTQASLREAISYVPQDPLLFHRTLRENIAYGNEKATEAEIIKAAKLAHAHDFINALPEGYDTMVGERGIKLSGGQRQRVAIARALLKKSHILILDEATSSLDSKSEKYIQEGLEELMKNKTAIIIAHRLSTVKHLDRILVLDKGEVVQDGTHDDLIKQGGLYAKLWGYQAGIDDGPKKKIRQKI